MLFAAIRLLLAAGAAADVDVFTAGQGEGSAGCYRIPAIIEVNSTLLVFAERRFVTCADGSPHSIELRRSTDGGRSWLPQQQLAAVPPAVTPKGLAVNGTMFIGSPVLDKQTGVLFLIFGNANSAFITRSSDAGATWTTAENGSVCSHINPGPGAGLQLASGRLVIPVQTDGRDCQCSGEECTKGYAGAMYSDDHGRSWKLSTSVPGAGETQLALTSKGTLLTIGHGDRQLERYQMFSESADGVSWGPVRRAASLVNIGSQQAMISATEADGRHFMYYTASHGIVLDLDRFDEVTSRRDGLVRYSQDDGRTWWLLEPAVIRAGPFMYSGIVRRGGNATHVTLGFVFESFRDQVAACDPWCGQLDEAPGSAGLGATAGSGLGEPGTNLTITYLERSFRLPPPQQP